VLEAIGLIEGNLRAAPEVTPRASLLCAEAVAGLRFRVAAKPTTCAQDCMFRWVIQELHRP
jgi:hypothetical protein